MTETIAIIDYGSGNLRSAAKAFEKVISDHNFPYTVIISSDPAEIAAASRLVLPGQGAYGDCIAGLRERSEIFKVLQQKVQHDKVPFLGICVGMQLMTEKGFEHGTHQGLGWVKGSVVKMQPSDKSMKIPHMGWNTLDIKAADHPALRHIKQGDHFYFVHSFMVELEDGRDMYASCNYGGEFPAIIGRDNMIGTQFHVEKSHDAGLRLIKGFVEWHP